MECSTPLRERLDRAFHLADHPEKDRYALVNMNYEGFCPILRDDGYCALQKECGEEVLPIVCRMYPRSVKHGTPNEAVMSASCELTAELLIKDDEPFFLKDYVADVPFTGIDSMFPNEAARDLNRTCIGLLSDRSVSLKERIGRMGELICGGKVLPEGTREEAVMTVLRLMRSYSRTSHAIGELSSSVFSVLGGDPDTLDPDSVDPAEAVRILGEKRAKFRAAFPKWEIWFEKIFCNHLFYMQFPSSDTALSDEKNYTAFCVCFALCGAVLPLLLAETDKTENFVDCLCELFRFAEHSRLYSIGKFRVIPDGLEAFSRFSPLF